MNYMKILQNAPALSVILGNSYSEDQLMLIFLDRFQQGGKYTAQIATHQAELRREVNFNYQKTLSISFLQTDYFNLGRSSGSVRNNKIEKLVQTKCTFCGGNNHSANNFFKG